MNSSSTDLRWVWMASEALLVATSVAAIIMLQRVFADGSFLAPMVFTVIVGHGVLIAMRWFDFGTAASGLASLGATGAAIVAIHYSGTALAAIVPTGGTVDQFRVDLEQAQTLFQTLQAPVPAVTGFLVIASFAFWLLAFGADWAAFRLFSPGQALIPFVAIIIFVSLLGTEDRRVATTGAVLTTAVLFLLAHRAASRAAQGVWLDEGPGRGYVSLMAAGGLVALVSMLAGLLGGPAVPGADEAALVELGDESKEKNRPLEVISPLVQIQPRLVDQSNEVLFTVETNQRAYWRIAALDVFDGALWRSQGQFRSADDDLPVGYPSGAQVDSITSTFDLGNLNVVWAPAAYLPVGFENLSGSGVNYEAESATFIVDTNDQQVSDGLVYRVTSQLPRFTPDGLRQLESTSTETVDSRYLDLPSDYSPLARQTAELVTMGMTTTYDKALALQNYFRDNFTYDIDVAKGHDIERLEDFLTVQRGYCEQFAGTYASMARAIGLPARVATGFTWGDEDPLSPGRYQVRGSHAHAWPEVFIAGAGWVPFEPTPGRGAPNASEYTGVPESQDSFDAAQQQDESTPGLAFDSAAESEVPVEPTPTPAAPQESDTQVEPELLPAPEPTELAGPPSNLLRNTLLALAAAALWIFGIPALKRWRASRRMVRIGTDTRRRITLAWAATADLLEAHQLAPHENETLLEYASRAQREQPDLHPAFGELTSLTVEAAYRSDLPSKAQADEAESLARRIKHQLDSSQPWPVRGAHEIDPRPLVRLSDPVADLADRLASGAEV